MTRRRAITWSAIGLAATIGMTAACSRPHAETVTASDVATVAVVKAARGDLARTLEITAAFRAFQEIDVHAKVAGYVKSIGVDVGDRVSAGQLLAVLEVPELQDDLQTDAAGIRHAEEELKRAQADVERAQSAHEVAHLSARRLAGVAQSKPNLVAQQEVDEGTARDRVSEAQIATAKASLAAAEQQLAIAKARENRTRTLVGYTRITAPFAGVITHRYADTGAMIQAGTSSQTQAMPLVKLSQTSRLRLVIPVPESAVGRLRTGAPVSLQVASLGKTFTGTVARFADRLDNDTRTMRAEVDVPNPTYELLPGMYATASIELERVRDVVLAPVEAVDREETKARVLIVNHDHRLESRDVELGLESGDRIQVVRGIEPDDELVVGNRGQLKVGSAVNPTLVKASDARGDQ